MSDEYKKGYKHGYADAMNWKVQNHLEHLPVAQPEPSPEWMTEEEQTAYTFGWFKALEKNNGSR